MGILRIILALSVLIAHFDANLSFGVGGPLAVRSFFMISGFYIAMIYKEKYEGLPKAYYYFLSNRILRIYPLYILVFIIAIMVNHVIGEANFYQQPTWATFSNFTKIYVWITNTSILGQTLNFFVSVNTQGQLFFTEDFSSYLIWLPKFMVLGQGWSVDLELLFYLLAPLLLKIDKKYLWPIIIASIVLRFVLLKVFQLNNEPWGLRFFPSEILFFILGILSYLYRKKIALSHQLQKVIFVIFICWTTLYLYIFKSNIINASFLHLAFFFVLFILIPNVFILSKYSKIDRYIGELSYPVYLIHGVTISLLLSFKVDNLLAAIILTVLFSIVLNEIVAKPIEKLRQKRIKTLEVLS